MPNTNKVIDGCGFHHVAVKVHDFGKSVRFYERLGFTQKAAWGEGDSQACLIDTGDGNYLEIFAGGPPDEKDAWGKGAALIHIALRTRDVPAALELAKQAGAKVTMEPRTANIRGIGGQSIPVRIAFCQAPGGEVIEFF
jgi:glyoxylase I family protein